MAFNMSFHHSLESHRVLGVPEYLLFFLGGWKKIMTAG